MIAEIENYHIVKLKFCQILANGEFFILEIHVCQMLWVGTVLNHPKI